MTNEYGQKLTARVEELKDAAEAEYEKSRKKKDPDFDRSTCNPRLPDDVISDLVRLQLNSAACQNKGFILDGYPRSKQDAKEVFMDKIPIPSEVPENEDPEGADEVESKFEEKLNEKIIPQYTISIEGDDTLLTTRAKELQDQGKHNDANMARRLKDWNTRNVPDSGETIKDFFNDAIGHANVLVVDSTTPE